MWLNFEPFSAICPKLTYCFILDSSCREKQCSPLNLAKGPQAKEVGTVDIYHESIGFFTGWLQICLILYPSLFFAQNSYITLS